MKSLRHALTLGLFAARSKRFNAHSRAKRKNSSSASTPGNGFLLSWARQWRTHLRDDDLRRQIAVGPHSPGQFRAIGPLVNMPGLFDAFEIKDGDPMRQKPEDRVKIG